MRPLKRKPKRLDETPTLHDASASGGAGHALVGGGDRRGPVPKSPGASLPGMTDEQGQVSEVDRDASVDAAALRRAREIAARLALPRPRRETAARGAGGELVSRRYRGGSDEIDLDATLAALVEHPHPTDEDILVRERIRIRRAVVLLVDVSGSMRGERIATAAATVGALAGELADDDLGVIAFWSDAAVLAHLGQRRDPRELLEDMLRIPARGLTNLAFPLAVAARELAGARSTDTRVILLSDCVHNAGPDPRQTASALPRLDVLLDVSGENDPELGRDLARVGHGRLVVARTYRDVAAGLSRFFQR